MHIKANIYILSSLIYSRMNLEEKFGNGWKGLFTDKLFVGSLLLFLIDGLILPLFSVGVAYFLFFVLAIFVPVIHVRHIFFTLYYSFKKKQASHPRLYAVIFSLIITFIFDLVLILGFLLLLTLVWSASSGPGSMIELGLIIISPLFMVVGLIAGYIDLSTNNSMGTKSYSIARNIQVFFITFIIIMLLLFFLLPLLLS